MSSSPEAADRFLRQFVCQEGTPALSESDRQAIREALQILAQQADYLTLGVCADTVVNAITGPNAYLAALNQNLVTEAATLSEIEAPLYIKCNTRTQKYYGSSYPGPYRGILVTCQSDYTDTIVGTYGHFPLDLFS